MKNNFDKNILSHSCPKLILIVPCYNEEEVIVKSIEILSCKILELKKQNLITQDSFIVFIDDGSTDNTYCMLKQLVDKYDFVAIKLSKNMGHQNALLAGLDFAVDKCDCTISVDCDLQQDIDKIEDFLECFRYGNDIVFGVRNDRKSDSFFKKYTALAFYKIMQIFGVNIIKNHADYRLLSNRALNFIKRYKESNLFLRGIFLEIGLKHSVVYFDVKQRELGTSKYNLKKMLSLALNGITSFSVMPLRIVFILGFIVSIISAIFGLYGIFIVLFSDSAVPGWASIVVPIYFLGGIQILSIGIIGEYIGKVYNETKHRPRYLIEEILGNIK